MLNYVSVAILVAAAIQNSAKYWSEWQDFNLRPPRPERGGAQHGDGVNDLPPILDTLFRRRNGARGGYGEITGDLVRNAH